MTTSGRFIRHEGPTIVAEECGFVDNPARALEQAFEEVYLQRMQDVPLCNHALRVEAVGFRRTEDGWLGVLVTPWFMNLMLLPARGARWTHMVLGAKRWHTFASGDYELFGSEEDGVGEYQYFSLFSPMAGFSAQEEALSVAQAALDLLVDASTAAKVDALGKSGADEAQELPEHPPEGAPPDLGKRNFLRGRFSHSHR
jgi:[NiFe] hydrogenase assembly HybE family chaperone